MKLLICSDGLLTDTLLSVVSPQLFWMSLFVKLAAVTKFIALLGDLIWLTGWMEIERY